MADMDPSPFEEAERKRRSLKPLRRIFPYMSRYRGMIAGALVSLVLAAVTTLTLPLAVRRMIDHGFTGANGAFINNYFGMLVVLAALLATRFGRPLLFCHHTWRADCFRFAPGCIRLI